MNEDYQGGLDVFVADDIGLLRNLCIVIYMISRLETDLIETLELL